MNKASINTDKEIWREIPDDYYSPSIHVTKDNRIGIHVGGYVVEKTAGEWFNSAQSETIKDKELIEKLAEKLHVNFYTLHKAFMHFANKDREHELTRDCWCHPRIVHVDSKEVQP